MWPTIAIAFRLPQLRVVPPLVAPHPWSARHVADEPTVGGFGLASRMALDLPSAMP